MTQIPLRLKEIAKMIPNNSYVADIGADHGILEKYLIANNNNVFVLAIENKIGPYKILVESLKALKNIRLSLSDGLEAVDITIDTIVLAGMGGKNIINILNRYPTKVKKCKRIIVDAHTDMPEVRRVITNFGYEIEKEKIVFENGKYYVIIAFKNVKKIPNYSDDEFEFGYQIYNDELWEKYRLSLLQKVNRSIRKIKGLESQSQKYSELLIYHERLIKYGKN